MKRCLSCLLVLALLLSLLPAWVSEPVRAAEGDLNNPINAAVSSPDPDVVYFGGYYYGLWTEGSQIVLHRSRTLADLTTGESKVVYKGSEFPTSIWGPTLVQDTDHNKWYIYADGVPKGAANSGSSHQIFCLEASSIWGTYSYKGVVLNTSGATDPSVYFTQNLRQPYLSYTKDGKVWVCRMDSYTSAKVANAVSVCSGSGADLFEYGTGYSSTLYFAYTAGSKIGLRRFTGDFRGEPLNVAGKWVDDGLLISSENNQAPSLFTGPDGNLYCAFHITGMTEGYNQWHRPLGFAKVGTNGTLSKNVSRPASLNVPTQPLTGSITDLSGYKAVYRGTNAQNAAKLLGLTTEAFSNQSGKIILVDSQDVPAYGKVRIAIEGQTIRICAASDKIDATVRYFMQAYLPNLCLTEADTYEGDLVTNPTQHIDAPDAFVQYVDGWYYGMWTMGGATLCLVRSRNLSDLTASPHRKYIDLSGSSEPLKDRIWAPEFFFDSSTGNPTSGKWVIYTTGAPVANGNLNIAAYVSDTADLWNSSYSYVGTLFPSNVSVLDATFFNQNGQLYMAYSFEAKTIPSGTLDSNGNVCINNNQYTAIARMKNYTAMDYSTVQVLHHADTPWELAAEDKATLNEGPEFLELNNKLYMAYSVHGGGGPDYSLGLLEFTGNYKTDNLAVRTKWKKLDQPFMSKDSRLVCTGHNSFFQDENGQPWIAVHCKDPNDNSSYWGCRMLSTQPVELNENGTPRMNNHIGLYAAHRQSGYATDANDWLGRGTKAYAVNGKEFTYEADFEVSDVKASAQLCFMFGSADYNQTQNRFILESSQSGRSAHEFVLGGALKGGYSFGDQVIDTLTTNKLHVTVHYKDGNADIDINGVKKSFTGLPACTTFFVGLEKVTALVHGIHMNVDVSLNHQQKVNDISGIYTFRAYNSLSTNKDLRLSDKGAINTYTAGDSFQWILERMEDDSYIIRNKKTGMCITAAVGEWNLSYKPQDNSDAQRWYPVTHDYRDPKVWHLVNKLNGRNLDLSGGSAVENGGVGAWAPGNGTFNDPELWVTEAVSTEYPLKAELPEGVYEIASVKNESFAAVADDDHFQIRTFKNTLNARFVFTKNPDNTYAIRSLTGGKYLSAKQDSSYWLYFSTTAADDLQKWLVLRRTDGSYCIRNAVTGKALDISDTKIAENQGIGEWTFTNGTHQLWKLKRMDTLIDGVYTISGLDGDAPYVIRHTADGDYILRKLSDAADPAERWSLVPNTDGTYRFVSLTDGSSLTVGGKIDLTLTPRKTVYDGVYQLGAFNDRSYVVDVIGHATDNGIKLQLLKNAQADGQKFAVEYRGNGCYTIRDIHSNRYLDVFSGSRTNDSELGIYGSESENINANKLFRILPNPDGSVSFVCDVSNQYMDLDNGTTKDNQKIHTWQTTLSGATQKWFLMPIGIGAEGDKVISLSDNASLTIGNDGDQAVLRSGTAAYAIQPDGGDYVLVRNTKYLSSDLSLGTAKALWSILPHYDGTVSIVSKVTGQYISADGSSLAFADDATARHWKLQNHSHAYTTQNTASATCTESGYSGDEACATCGNVKTYGSLIPALGHAVATDPAKAPTCTATGLSEGSHCSRCNAVLKKQETVPALDHSWNDGVVTVQPTETTEGVRTYTCTRCYATRTEAIPKVGHVHNYTSTVTAPTCTEQGFTTHTCTCGDRYVDTYVPALGHSWSVGMATRQPTCTEPGIWTYRCQRCNAARDEALDPLGHAWNDGVVTVQPTETTEGVRTYTCTRCNATRTEAIPKLGHVHNYTATVTAPTCTEQGFTTHTCTCGDKYVDGIIPALGHSWGEAETSMEPAFHIPGEMLRRCAVCGATQTEAIEPVGCPTKDFTDVQYPEWYHDAADWAVSHGYIKGITPTTFAVTQKANRAMLVTILHRMAGEPEVVFENPFMDVNENHYFYKAVLWAASEGVVNGTSPTTFEATKNLTREQAVTILHRYTRSCGVEPTGKADLTVFPDGEKIGSYAEDAMAWAVANKLINGNPIGGVDMLDAKGQANRGQLAVILMKFSALINK